MVIGGFLLMLIGGLIALIYGIKLIILAFQASIWWGLGYILIPFVGLIFIILHWHKAKDPFLKSLVSIPFCVIGAILMETQKGI